ncbi:hypothetical protein [Geothrix limicola]|uniref:hypothetical protein n=1 Tax=Geothrix limicola TaxID=2927978 RepID=UPI002552270F|nr:hypothetical protein [Geothrix limicola]
MLKTLLSFFAGKPKATSPKVRPSAKPSTGKARSVASEITELVKTRKSANIPLMDIRNELYQMFDGCSDLALMTACMKAADKIEDTLVNRNLRGKELEKSGELSKAIKLYESNLIDRFDGSHPYERLRIIYNSKGKHQDVIRVCQAFIDFGGNAPELKEKYRSIITKLAQ